MARRYRVQFAIGNRASGVAVLSHGITVDRHEEVMFDRLSDDLYANAMTTLSFDFRGHGESQVPAAERGMTLTGQLLDLQAVIEYARSELGGPLHLLGSSFGAASTCLLLDIFGDIVSTVSLWNPVLDLTRTFLEPETIWSRENFSSEK